MTTRLDDFEFSSDDLRQVHKFIAKSLALYQNEDIRMVNLDDFHLVHKGILDLVKFQRKLKTFTPDGITRVACKSFKAPALRAVISFTEIRNGTRKGGSNPIHQAQCDYVAFYSAEALHFFFFSFLCSELQTHDHLLFFFTDSVGLFEMRVVVPHSSLVLLALIWSSLVLFLWTVSFLSTWWIIFISEESHILESDSTRSPKFWENASLNWTYSFVQTSLLCQFNLTGGPGQRLHRVSPSFLHFTTSNGSYELQYTEWPSSLHF